MRAHCAEVEARSDASWFSTARKINATSRRVIPNMSRMISAVESRRVRQLANDVDSIYEILDEVKDTQQDHGIRLQTMSGQLDQLGKVQAQHGVQLVNINNRLNGVDSRFDRVDSRLDGVESRLDRVESRLDGVGSKLERQGERLHGLDMKLDQILDRLP